MNIVEGGTPIWVVLGPDPSADDDGSRQTILSMTDNEDEAEAWLCETILTLATHHSKKLAKGGSFSVHVQRASVKRQTKMTASLVYRGSRTHKHEWNFSVDCWTIQQGRPLDTDRELQSAMSIFEGFGKEDDDDPAS